MTWVAAVGEAHAPVSKSKTVPLAAVCASSRTLRHIRADARRHLTHGMMARAVPRSRGMMQPEVQQLSARQPSSSSQEARAQQLECGVKEIKMQNAKGEDRFSKFGSRVSEQATRIDELSSCVNVKPSRDGEETLCSDCVSQEVKRWFMQLRRLQSLVQAVKADKSIPDAQTYRAAWNLRKRTQLLQTRMAESRQDLFRALRRRLIVCKQSFAVVDAGEWLASCGCSLQNFWGESQWHLHGQPAQINRVDTQLCSIPACLQVDEDSELVQTQTLSSVQDVQQEFVGLWAPRWRKHQQVTARTWDRVIQPWPSSLLWILTCLPSHPSNC